ncbi:MAG TPA: hypothetical protein VF468_22130 [Actinomycetota bacterium]|nr:hypothetical protein [Actinomycetota bacterium]
MLYRDLQPSVLRYLRILAPGAAEDLAAETWLRVVGKLIRWSPIRTGKPPARPWTTYMGKLLVVRRLLEAEERLPKREPWTDPM